MADTRGIRELAFDFAVKEGFNRPIDKSLTDALTAFAESIVEQCCKAVCSECRKGDEPERGRDGRWYHTMLGFDDRTEDCHASSIRSRWQRGEGQV